MLFRSSEKPGKVQVIPATVHQRQLLCLGSGTAAFELTSSGMRRGELHNRGVKTRPIRLPVLIVLSNKGLTMFMLKQLRRTTDKQNLLWLLPSWSLAKAAESKIRLLVDYETMRKVGERQTSAAYL